MAENNAGRKAHRSGGLDRRDFLRLLLAGSGASFGSSRLFGVSSSSPGTPPGAQLHSLPAGEIRPEGWLRVYLEKQATQLCSHLPEVSSPFTSSYWAGEEKAESWWPWEQYAYWVDGATRLSLVLNAEPLLEKARQSIDFTLSHPGANHYLGPKNFADPKGDFHRWPQAIFFRALAALSDSQNRSDIAEAVRLHYLSDGASYAEPTRNIANLESMLWCYGRTGDPRLLALAENSWLDYLKGAGEQEHGDLSEARVFAGGPISSHGVTYIEIAKQPAILYMHTRNQKYLRFALAAQRRIFDHHMLIDGVPSTSEVYRTRTSLDSHETCNVTDHAWSWTYMLMATGDAIWADRIERACLNAGMGAVKKDWKALQYFSCPNQILATLNSDHNSMSHGGRLMAFQPNPGENVACCAGNVHRLFPNYVIGMWMKDNDHGVAATLYGPSTLTTRVGKKQQEVVIEQQTDFPFSEQVHFTIRAKRPVDFPLSFRIPAWCCKPEISLNGKPIDLPPVEQGFVRLHREFHPNDRISLKLSMKFDTTRWPQNGIAIEHGPLVYSLATAEKWAAVVEPTYSTAEFPCWNATPLSSWNYGLIATPALPAVHATLERKAMTVDPWVDPPVSVRVAARKINSWQLQTNDVNQQQSFTPPLPKMDDSEVSKVVDHLKLAPYGSTHLRVTIFPELPEKPDDPSDPPARS